MTAWEKRAHALMNRAPMYARVAEIGFGVGKMARVLLRERPDIVLTMIDSFKPAVEQPESYLRTGDNFARRLPNEADKHYQMAKDLAAAYGATVLRLDSLEAAETAENGGFDVVFIDADHSYGAVKADIAAWSPKVAENGVIGGHDYENKDPRFDFSGVRRAVDEWAEAEGHEIELDANFTWWARL